MSFQKICRFFIKSLFPWDWVFWSVYREKGQNLLLLLLAASVAGIVAALLQLKTELHGLVMKFTREEVRSILQFVLLSLVILPVVPDQTYGPYGFFNPYNIWLMVVLIVGISLSGYIFYKFLGEKAGMFLSGIIGGILSSTATTFSHSKAARGDDQSFTYSGMIILIAWATLYPRVFFELAVTSPQFSSIRIPLLLMTFFSILPLLWIWRRSKARITPSTFPPNPSELRTAFIFALMYSVVLFASSYA